MVLILDDDNQDAIKKFEVVLNNQMHIQERRENSPVNVNVQTLGRHSGN